MKDLEVARHAIKYKTKNDKFPPNTTTEPDCDGNNLEISSSLPNQEGFVVASDEDDRDSVNEEPFIVVQSKKERRNLKRWVTLVLESLLEGVRELLLLFIGIKVFRKFLDLARWLGQTKKL